MLNAYLTATRRLIQNPPAPVALYSDADLTSYVNTARGQLAGDSESIRNYATLAISQGVQKYDFSAIVLGSPTAGIKGPLNIRAAWYQVGDGQVWLRPRPWEWFSLYELNNPVPQQGPPKMWTQYGQGVGGSIFVSPVPDTDYVLPLDTMCYPLPLVDDTTAEAIPYPWTDAVPFFAAYYAYLGAQSGARQADAERMMQRYTEFVNRARRSSNPSVSPYIYEQAPDPVRANRLSLGGGPAQPPQAG